MRKIISLALSACMLLSIIPIASATRDYTQGTQVVYTSSGTESYTITVPALLVPGGDGTVTLSGTWAENRVVTVTAESTVTLTNSIKETDTKTLNVNFDGISESGSNTGSQTFTERVAVDDITNALFGTWSGKFNYNVAIADAPLALGCDTLYWDGNTDGLEYVDVPAVGAFEGGTYYKVADYVAITESSQISNMSMYAIVGDQIQIFDMSMQEWRDTLSPVQIDFEANANGWSAFAFAIGSDGNFVHTENSDVVIPAGIWFMRKAQPLDDEGTMTDAYIQSIKIPGYTGFQHSEHCGH